MLPDRVSNRGPLTYESGALPIALRGPAATEYRPPVYKDNAFSSPMSRLCRMCYNVKEYNATCLQFLNRGSYTSGHFI